MLSVKKYLQPGNSTRTLVFCMLYLLICLFIGISNATAQVQVAPVALHLSDDNKTGRIVVRNSSDYPMELNMELLFGYPDTDQEGNVYLKVFDAIPETEPSATGWIRIYPRHLTLPPNQQQTIRFAARPPQNLPEGEYWARPAVAVKKGKTQKTRVNSGISTQINLIRRTILSLNYRHGKVHTGILIQDASATSADGKLNVYTDLKRKGNAAYLGHVDIRLYDTSGKLHRHIRQEIAVYYRQSRKFEIDTHNLSPGAYKVEVTLSTESRAAQNKSILPAPPVTKTAAVTIK